MQPLSRLVTQICEQGPMPAEATKRNKMPRVRAKRSRRQLVILLVLDSIYPLERLRVPFTCKPLI